jgi:hypothetical protein
MEKLITNAISQHNAFGKVIITIYPNKSVNDCYDIIEHNLSDAIHLIGTIYSSINDDVHVAHINSFK